MYKRIKVIVEIDVEFDEHMKKALYNQIKEYFNSENNNKK